MPNTYGPNPIPAKNFRSTNPGRVCRTCYYLNHMGGEEYLCTRPGEIVFESEVETFLYVCDGFRYPETPDRADRSRKKETTVGDLKPFIDSLRNDVSVITHVNITSHDTNDIPFEIIDIETHEQPELVWVTMRALPTVPVPKRYKQRRVACDRRMKITIVQPEE